MRAIPAVLFILIAQPLVAQTSNTPVGPPSGRVQAQREDGWSVTIGVASVVSPVWQGSRDMAFSIFPDLRINYKDEIFASMPDGVGWNVVNSGGWKAGPIGKIRFGRDEDRGGSPFLIAGGSDALKGLGDVPAAFEVGGFVEKRTGPLRGRVEARKALGGHNGVIMDASLTYQQRFGRTIVSIGPRATIASKAFMNTYFGIDAKQSQPSGLTPYSASGGLASYGVGASIVRPLDRRSALTLFAGLDRLGEEARNSPLVRDRGRSSQATIGAGYGFRFNL